jgi:hypothetical protein
MRTLVVLIAIDAPIATWQLSQRTGAGVFSIDSQTLPHALAGRPLGRLGTRPMSLEIMFS